MKIISRLSHLAEASFLAKKTNNRLANEMYAAIINHAFHGDEKAMLKVYRSRHNSDALSDAIERIFDKGTSTDLKKLEHFIDTEILTPDRVLKDSYMQDFIEWLLEDPKYVKILQKEMPDAFDEEGNLKDEYWDNM